MIQETVAQVLHEWDSFYVIVGSSAAALTGLMFVVITLVADKRSMGNAGEIAAFGTPTVFHLSFVLVVSALGATPWQTFVTPGVLLGVIGAGGLGYEAITTIRAFRSRGYQPVFEDWVFHVVLPLIAYVLVIAGAVMLPHDTRHAAFTVAAAMLTLLVVGIHNAWDTVTYIALMR